MLADSNLIWIDLEMTGLEPETDVIIEIATIVTDAQLNVLAEILIRRKSMAIKTPVQSSSLQRGWHWPSWHTWWSACECTQ